MQSIGKQFIDPPVECNPETLPERFSRRCLDRCAGAVVLDLDTLVGGASLDHYHCGHKDKDAGYPAHKRQLSPGVGKALATLARSNGWN